MSEKEYTKELERLIIEVFLPQYELYCKENNIDIYKSGIPLSILNRLKNKKQVAALLRKHSGC